MIRKVLLIALMLSSISGCTSTISNFVYEGAKSGLPNSSATLTEKGESIVWEFNPREDATLVLSDYSWQTLHHGAENNWSWRILGTENFSLSDAEAREWDSLLSQLTQYSATILPQVIDTEIAIYLVPGPEKHVSISTPNAPGEIRVPFVVWSEPDAETYLPDLFGEQSDLIGYLGSTLQLGYYEKNLLPRPEEPTASQLKKYANANCWRLAVRPALALGTDNKVKTPAVNDYALGITEAMYTSNEDEVEATLIYTSMLLLSDADDYMASLDLNWPQSGRDETEINALLKFCSSYLANNKDPRK